MEKQKKIKRCASDRVLITIFYILVAIFAIVCLYPLLLAIGTSFADEASVTVNGYRVIPKKFSLSAYQMILGSMGKNLLNAYTVTIGVTVFGTLLSVLVSAAFAYVLTVREFKPKGALNMFLYIPMIFRRTSALVHHVYQILPSDRQLPRTGAALLYERLQRVPATQFLQVHSGGAGRSGEDRRSELSPHLPRDLLPAGKGRSRDGRTVLRTELLERLLSVADVYQ